MPETAEKRTSRRKYFQGTVVSDKMNKTRVIKVDWTTTHAKYHKVIRRATKYKAHDEKNETQNGDFVRIMETRRLSKDKRWVICNIIRKYGEVK